jgi:3-hydroxyacyl-[acyl-carrier-protein] dehydratase
VTSGRTPIGGFTGLGSLGDNSEASSRLALDEANPLFSGHFPGEPILPGVAHLGLALQAAEQLEKRPVVLSGVRDFRLRQVVRPGDEVEVRVNRTSRAGEIRFEVRKGDLVASSGVLTLGFVPLHG